MQSVSVSRRQFIQVATSGLVAALVADSPGCSPGSSRPVVSITRVPNDNIDYAVEEAIELLGGIREVTTGKEQVLLKPNLVAPLPHATTNPAVIGTLARLMSGAGKDVTIGEGSAAAEGFNVQGQEIFRTSKPVILERMQAHVFEQLGFEELSQTMNVPLVNLHTGDLVDVDLPGGFVYDKLTLHRAMVDTDLLVSVPMMKTHSLAQVTLGMKNLIGAYPGTIYQSVRGAMHDKASDIEPSGTASAIVDIVRASKLGLVVIDGSSAMEGNGPTQGTSFKMGVIIAGMNPLATDMVAASVMGFRPDEIPTFQWANKAGLQPASLDEIEVRGVAIDEVRKPFARPQVVEWKAIRDWWGAREV